MRHRVVVVVIATIASTFGAPASAAPAEPPPGDMVSWWRGEGDAVDTADGNDGTLVGGAWFSISGKVGAAFELDGNDDVITAGNPANLQLAGGSMTVEGWVNADTLSGPGGVPGQYCTGDGCDMNVARKSVDNTDGWSLIKQADNRFWFCLGPGCSPGNGYTLQSTTVVSTGVWYHVAAVRTQTTFSLYVNGVLEASAALSSGFTDTDTNAVSIGKFWDGRIDELSIYGRALSGDEIAAIAAADTDGKCPTRGTSSATVETVTGTNGDDEMCGLGGRDRIDALEGDDWASGGLGNDRLLGRKGNDSLFGDAGQDALHGGAGHDSLDGGANVDTFLGGAGNDTIHAGDGNAENVDGGTGNDTCYVDNGLDVVSNCETVVTV